MTKLSFREKYKQWKGRKSVLMNEIQYFIPVMAGLIYLDFSCDIFFWIKELKSDKKNSHVKIDHNKAVRNYWIPLLGLNFQQTFYRQVYFWVWAFRMNYWDMPYCVMDCWSSEKHNLPFTGDGKCVTKVQKFQTEFQIHDRPRYKYNYRQFCKPKSINISSMGHNFPCFGCRKSKVA